LVKKLGIKPGFRFAFVREPAGFRDLLVDLPSDLAEAARGELDFAILFVTKFSELRKDFSRLMTGSRRPGALGVVAEEIFRAGDRPCRESRPRSRAGSGAR
jgi:hypothetical protein